MKKFLSVLALTSCFTGAAFAMSTLDNRIWESNEVIKEFYSIPETEIPPSLLKQAKAIAIFPNTAKAGFVVAGQFGNGVILRKDDKGVWSAPAFFRISGGSVGFQIGGQASDIILVVTTDRGVQGVLQNKFTLGADASVAAGPKGRDADASTDWKMKANIISYSRSKGLFAGVSVEGMVINQDKESNASFYGPDVDANAILMEGKGKKSPEAEKLIETIEAHAK